MPTILIKNTHLIHKSRITHGDILVKNGFIERIDPVIDSYADREIDASQWHALPGIIDDQVHFREPGLTHKADIHSEARAAVAGGTTTFMEMPNTKPSTLSQSLLQEKYEIAARNSLANYSFYMGASNDNLEEVLRTNPADVCGIKVFMGSSTGNMLVDDPGILEKIFAQAPMLVATHCEDEATIRRNEEIYRNQYGEDVPMSCHPLIRSAQGCLISSSLAVNLAQQHNTRLHILHISTADEVNLFDNQLPLEQKRITAEVCVHHLHFHAGDYERLGAQIKCNPAVKACAHQEALWQALLNDHFDVIATDHAPHTWLEKQNKYFECPSGVPLVQHSLNIMLEAYHAGKISLEKIVQKMCHAPAICFQIDRRGFLQEGYWADITLVDLQEKWKVDKSNVLYQCGWSPFENHIFTGKVKATMVSGHLAYFEGKLDESQKGERLLFDRY